MDDDFAQQMGLLLGQEVEIFYPLPKPTVRLHGAAENAAGHRPLANLVELSSSRYNYIAVIELPQVQFCEDQTEEVEWTVTQYGEVSIEGMITPAAIAADGPITGNRRNRVQLCRTDQPWVISFYFPGPVRWWTASVFFTSESLMEISVMKLNPRVFGPLAEISAGLVPVPRITNPGPGPGSDPGASSSLGPGSDPGPSSSQGPVPSSNPGPEGDTLPTWSEIMDRIDE